jgi:hypothetical protein
MVEYLTSTFIIPCSIFVICFFRAFFRLDWKPAASGGACMKLNEVKSEPQNIEQEISNDEVWNR